MISSLQFWAYYALWIYCAEYSVEFIKQMVNTDESSMYAENESTVCLYY